MMNVDCFIVYFMHTTCQQCEHTSLKMMVELQFKSTICKICLDEISGGRSFLKNFTMTGLIYHVRKQCPEFNYSNVITETLFFDIGKKNLFIILVHY